MEKSKKIPNPHEDYLATDSDGSTVVINRRHMIRDVRQVLCNEMGLTKDTVEEVIKSIFKSELEVIVKEYINLRGGIEKLIKSIVNEELKSNNQMGSYGRSALELAIKDAIGTAAKNYINENVTINIKDILITK